MPLSAGYGAKIIEAKAAHDHSQRKLSGWQLNLWIGVLGTAPLMIGEWLFGLEMQSWFRWLAFALAIAASVLIVACPCAMGLATPAAIMAGTNAAARRGILIRDGVALEKAGRVTAVVFDKTGTLTTGKPVVVQTWKSEQDISIVAALARHSTHPIGQAIAKTSTDKIHR